jgi:uncharacterized membrane protein
MKNKTIANLIIVGYIFAFIGSIMEEMTVSNMTDIIYMVAGLFILIFIPMGIHRIKKHNTLFNVAIIVFSLFIVSLFIESAEELSGIVSLAMIITTGFIVTFLYKKDGSEVLSPTPESTVQTPPSAPTQNIPPDQNIG